MNLEEKYSKKYKIKQNVIFFGGALFLSIIAGGVFLSNNGESLVNALEGSYNSTGSTVDDFSYYSNACVNGESDVNGNLCNLYSGTDVTSNSENYLYQKNNESVFSFGISKWVSDGYLSTGIARYYTDSYVNVYGGNNSVVKYSQYSSADFFKFRLFKYIADWGTVESGTAFVPTTTYSTSDDSSLKITDDEGNVIFDYRYYSSKDAKYTKYLAVVLGVSKKNTGNTYWSTSKPGDTSDSYYEASGTTRQIYAEQTYSSELVNGVGTKSYYSNGYAYIYESATGKFRRYTVDSGTLKYIKENAVADSTSGLTAQKIANAVNSNASSTSLNFYITLDDTTIRNINYYNANVKETYYTYEYAGKVETSNSTKLTEGSSAYYANEAVLYRYDKYVYNANNRIYYNYFIQSSIVNAGSNYYWGENSVSSATSFNNTLQYYSSFGKILKYVSTTLSSTQYTITKNVVNYVYSATYQGETSSLPNLHSGAISNANYGDQYYTSYTSGSRVYAIYNKNSALNSAYYTNYTVNNSNIATSSWVSSTKYVQYTDVYTGQSGSYIVAKTDDSYRVESGSVGGGNAVVWTGNTTVYSNQYCVVSYNTSVYSYGGITKYNDTFNTASLKGRTDAFSGTIYTDANGNALNPIVTREQKRYKVHRLYAVAINCVTAMDNSWWSAKKTQCKYNTVYVEADNYKTIQLRASNGTTYGGSSTSMALSSYMSTMYNSSHSTTGFYYYKSASSTSTSYCYNGNTISTSGGTDNFTKMQINFRSSWSSSYATALCSNGILLTIYVMPGGTSNYTFNEYYTSFISGSNSTDAVGYTEYDYFSSYTGNCRYKYSGQILKNTYTGKNYYYEGEISDAKSRSRRGGFAWGNYSFYTGSYVTKTKFINKFVCSTYRVANDEWLYTSDGAYLSTGTSNGVYTITSKGLGYDDRNVGTFAGKSYNDRITFTYRETSDGPSVRKNCEYVYPNSNGSLIGYSTSNSVSNSQYYTGAPYLNGQGGFWTDSNAYRIMYKLYKYTDISTSSSSSTVTSVYYSTDSGYNTDGRKKYSSYNSNAKTVSGETSVPSYVSGGHEFVYYTIATTGLKNYTHTFTVYTRQNVGSYVNGTTYTGGSPRYFGETVNGVSTTNSTIGQSDLTTYYVYQGSTDTGSAPSGSASETRYLSDSDVSNDSSFSGHVTTSIPSEVSSSQEYVWVKTDSDVKYRYDKYSKVLTTVDNTVNNTATGVYSSTDKNATQSVNLSSTGYVSGRNLINYADVVKNSLASNVDNVSYDSTTKHYTFGSGYATAYSLNGLNSGEIYTLTYSLGNKSARISVNGQTGTYNSLTNTYSVSFSASNGNTLVISGSGYAFTINWIQLESGSAFTQYMPYENGTVSYVNNGNVYDQEIGVYNVSLYFSWITNDYTYVENASYNGSETLVLGNQINVDKNDANYSVVGGATQNTSNHSGINNVAGYTGETSTFVNGNYITKSGVKQYVKVKSENEYNVFAPEFTFGFDTTNVIYSSNETLLSGATSETTFNTSFNGFDYSIDLVNDANKLNVKYSEEYIANYNYTVIDGKVYVREPSAGYKSYNRYELQKDNNYPLISTISASVDEKTFKNVYSKGFKEVTTYVSAKQIINALYGDKYVNGNIDNYSYFSRVGIWNDSDNYQLLLSYNNTDDKVSDLESFNRINGEGYIFKIDSVDNIVRHLYELQTELGHWDDKVETIEDNSKHVFDNTTVSNGTTTYKGITVLNTTNKYVSSAENFGLLYDTSKIVKDIDGSSVYVGYWGYKTDEGGSIVFLDTYKNLKGLVSTSSSYISYYKRGVANAPLIKVQIAYDIAPTTQHYSYTLKNADSTSYTLDNIITYSSLVYSQPIVNFNDNYKKAIENIYTLKNHILVPAMSIFNYLNVSFVGMSANFIDSNASSNKVPEFIMLNGGLNSTQVNNSEITKLQAVNVKDNSAVIIDDNSTSTKYTMNYSVYVLKELYNINKKTRVNYYDKLVKEYLPILNKLYYIAQEESFYKPTTTLVTKVTQVYDFYDYPGLNLDKVLSQSMSNEEISLAKNTLLSSRTTFNDFLASNVLNLKERTIEDDEFGFNELYASDTLTSNTLYYDGYSSGVLVDGEDSLINAEQLYSSLTDNIVLVKDANYYYVYQKIDDPSFIQTMTVTADGQSNCKLSLSSIVDTDSDDKNDNTYLTFPSTSDLSVKMTASSYGSVSYNAVTEDRKNKFWLYKQVISNDSYPNDIWVTSDIESKRYENYVKGNIPVINENTDGGVGIYIENDKNKTGIDNYVRYENISIQMNDIDGFIYFDLYNKYKNYKVGETEPLIAKMIKEDYLFKEETYITTAMNGNVDSTYYICKPSIFNDGNSNNNYIIIDGILLIGYSNDVLKRTYSNFNNKPPLLESELNNGVNIKLDFNGSADSSGSVNSFSNGIAILIKNGASLLELVQKLTVNNKITNSALENLAIQNNNYGLVIYTWQSIGQTKNYVGSYGNRVDYEETTEKNYEMQMLNHYNEIKNYRREHTNYVLGNYMAHYAKIQNYQVKYNVTDNKGVAIDGVTFGTEFSTNSAIYTVKNIKNIASTSGKFAFVEDESNNLSSDTNMLLNVTSMRLSIVLESDNKLIDHYEYQLYECDENEKEKALVDLNKDYNIKRTVDGKTSRWGLATGSTLAFDELKGSTNYKVKVIAVGGNGDFISVQSKVYKTGSDMVNNPWGYNLLSVDDKALSDNYKQRYINADEQAMFYSTEEYIEGLPRKYRAYKKTDGYLPEKVYIKFELAETPGHYLKNFKAYFEGNSRENYLTEQLDVKYVNGYNFYTYDISKIGVDSKNLLSNIKKNVLELYNGNAQFVGDAENVKGVDRNIYDYIGESRNINGLQLFDDYDYNIRLIENGKNYPLSDYATCQINIWYRIAYACYSSIEFIDFNGDGKPSAIENGKKYYNKNGVETKIESCAVNTTTNRIVSKDFVKLNQTRVLVYAENLKRYYLVVKKDIIGVIIK